MFTDWSFPGNSFMDTTEKQSSTQRLKKLVIGEARSLSDPSLFHKMSLIAFFAWVGLGADGITSSCYGPEEAFLTFGSHIYLSIFVAIGAVLTIFIISASYNQIIDLFPTGGGGYLVASKLLSPSLGMISGCALLIDYLLTITLSIASGTDALFSFMPAAWLPYKLYVAVAGVLILTWLNMRGVKESVVPLVPIFICFILTHAFAIIYGIVSHLGTIPDVVQATANDIHSTTSEMGILGMIFLILRSYSMGAGTYTGIEAVSNGIPILREPKALTARRTMTYMTWSLAFMVAGLMIAYILYNVTSVPGKTLNAVLLDNITKDWGKSGHIFVLVTLFSEATLLTVAAQTGFLGGPRVLSNMAMDRWVPTRFSSLNDRLVTQNGILIMGIAAAILMLYSRGSVRFLVVLYSIDVFITFFLSQLGMVKHWWQSKNIVKRWKKKLFINGLGLVLTSFILVSMVILKFDEGGWITILITGAFVAGALIVKRHYGRTFKLLNRLNSLVDVTKKEIEKHAKKFAQSKTDPDEKINRDAKTAVLFVNGFSGTGLHTLFSIIRFFGGIYKNFVFVQIGQIDSGVFKGADELNELKKNIETDAERYVQYMRQNGYHAECVTSVAIDVVEESIKIAPKILEQFPQSVFFTGQLVFPEDSLLTRWLHNYTSFAIQRKFYHLGLPIVILPIRV
jgi:amino acid transporter